MKENIKSLLGFGQKNPGNSIKNIRKMRKIGKVSVAVLRIVFLLAIGYIILYPLLYMLFYSVRGGSSYMDPSAIWIPREITFKYFDVAMKSIKFSSSIVSTLKNEVISAAIEVVTCSTIAYGLARFDFKLKRVCIFCLFLTILVPPQMMMIPLVVNYANLDFLGIISLLNEVFKSGIRINLLNSSFAFWLPSLFGVGIRSGILIYIYMQFFKGLPRELEEAAWVDGAGPIRTFVKIAIPSSGVVILTVTVFSMIWHWNDYYTAVMLLTENQTLAVSLSGITESMKTYGYYMITTNPESVSILMAGCTLFVLPMLIMYLFVQKGFIKSIDRVGITG